MAFLRDKTDDWDFGVRQPRPKMNVYCAGKLRHAALFRDLRAGRLNFCNIVSSWIDSPEAQTEAEGSFQPPGRYAEIWTIDCKEASKADFVLLYAEDEDWPKLSGSIFEMGACIAKSGSGLIVGYPPINFTWTWHPRIIRTDSQFFDPAIEILKRCS